MTEKKQRFWERLFGKVTRSDNMPPAQPLVVPKITLSADHSWSVAGKDGNAIDTVYLRQQMSNHLSVEQLREMVVHFDLLPEQLQGGKGRQVLVLITAVSEQQKLPDLLQKCKEINPTIKWQIGDPST